MPLVLDSIPFPTPLDNSEDPPSSIDPLGFNATAEKLADLLLPAFTVRMERARLITFTALAAWLSEKMAERADGDEGRRLNARLELERFFVWSVALLERSDPEGYRGARKGLPGSDLARTHASRKDYKDGLSHHNFLKGQAVNGPFGVMFRMARALDLVDERGLPAPAAPMLLQIWASEVGLDGLLHDESERDQPGVVWIRDVVRRIEDRIDKGIWPNANQKIWEAVSACLRPDRMGPKERECISGLLRTSKMQGGERMGRTLDLLVTEAVRKAYQAAAPGGRGAAEQAAFQVMEKSLTSSEIDLEIAVIIPLIDAFEKAASLLERALDVVRYELTHRGSMTRETLSQSPEMRARIPSLLAEIPQARRALHLAWKSAAQFATAAEGPISKLEEDLAAAEVGVDALVDVLFSRHAQIQKQKRKGQWFDEGETVIVLPSFGLDSLPSVDSPYTHPYRLGNAYAILRDLGEIVMEEPVGQQAE